MGTDGRIHLAYEMLFTNTVKLLFPNTTNGTVRLDSVEVVDPAHDNKVVGINHVFAAEQWGCYRAILFPGEALYLSMRGRLFS